MYHFRCYRYSVQLHTLTAYRDAFYGRAQKEARNFPCCSVTLTNSREKPLQRNFIFILESKYFFLSIKWMFSHHISRGYRSTCSSDRTIFWHSPSLYSKMLYWEWTSHHKIFLVNNELFPIKLSFQIGKILKWVKNKFFFSQ